MKALNILIHIYSFELFNHNWYFVCWINGIIEFHDAVMKQLGHNLELLPQIFHLGRLFAQFSFVIWLDNYFIILIKQIEPSNGGCSDNTESTLANLILNFIVIQWRGILALDIYWCILFLLCFWDIQTPRWRWRIITASCPVWFISMLLMTGLFLRGV